MGTIPISDLAPQVLDRLQDPSAIFWNLNNEVYAALVEGISELMLLVGRPTLQFDTQITLEANTVWQPMPANILAITDIRTSSYKLWKTTLHQLDYPSGGWGPDWESDRDYVPQRWAPLGLNYFIVHPAPIQPIQVNVAGVTYPITDNWPPTGAETVPFQNEFFEALEMYAAFYCRAKDQGDDAAEGNALYQAFLDLAKRMTVIQDRRDDVIFSASLGAQTTPTQTTRR